MKQTAVEWLDNQITICFENYSGSTLYHRITEKIEEAKEIEKNQIIEARQDGYDSTYNSCQSGCMGREILEGSNEQYYNKTFKKE